MSEPVSRRMLQYRIKGTQIPVWVHPRHEEAIASGDPAARIGGWASLEAMDDSVTVCAGWLERVFEVPEGNDPYNEAYLQGQLVAALRRAVRAIEVSSAPDLDDGTVRHDVRIKGLLARYAMLFDICLSAGLAGALAWVLDEEAIGEDLVMATLYRRLEACGVDRSQVWDAAP